jgi:hypothetical protein
MATVDRAAPQMRSDSIFFPAMAIAMAVTVFAGFAQSWFLKPVFHAPPEISPLIAVHGAVFTAWIAILVTQTAFVANNRRDLHMQLGIGGFVVAVAMLVLGTALSIDALKRGFAPPGSPPAPIFFAIPIGDMVAFIPMLWLGWANRRRAAYHKRYMILATALLLDAAVARVPLGFIENGGIVVAFMICDCFILITAAYDFAMLRRVHPATLTSGAIIIGSQVLRLAISQTAAWHGFAMWLAG